MRYAFLMIKTHAVRERSVGAILRDVEVAGFTIRQMRMLNTANNLDPVRHLYADHLGKPYYNRLIDSVTGQLVACLLEHGIEDGIDCIRTLAGATNPVDADPRTLRRRYGNELPHNAVHTSDSPKALLREALLFFDMSDLPEELWDAWIERRYS